MQIYHFKKIVISLDKHVVMRNFTQTNICSIVYNKIVNLVINDNIKKVFVPTLGLGVSPFKLSLFSYII